MFDPFRSVPRTGVIFVMTEASRQGFHYGNPDWANLGQGAPETGELPGAPARLTNIPVDPAMHEYAPVGGLWALREAVANLYNVRYRKGKASQYTAENVAISGGGRLALARIAASLGQVNIGHLLPDYTAYAELLDVFRAFVPIPNVIDAADGWQLSADRLRREIVGKGLGGLLLSNPCNPTGQTLRGHALRATVATSRELGCALILDEFYAHYLYGDAARQDGPSLSAARYVEDVDQDPVILVDGLTKNWRYPGWRLAWTVAPKSLIERITSAGSFLDGGPSHPMQAAAIPLLDPAIADQEARAIQETFGAKRRLLLDMGRAMGLTMDASPMGAFYGFVGLDSLPEGLRDGMDFFRRALERKVIVVPGEFFDIDPGRRRAHIPSRLRNYVRLSFGPDLETLRGGLTRLDDLIRAG